MAAGFTPSRADDLAVIRTALAGNDTIWGSDYVDLLDGFNGNDTIRAWGGNDRVYGEAGADTLEGMVGSDMLDGGTGSDRIIGGAGNDVIYGGIGNDNLTGGVGNDYFVFNTALGSSNIDRISDFNVAADTVRIDNGVMPGLGTHLGTLSSAMFWKSAAGVAHDSNDRIIYETDTGKLFYDSNGNAAGGSHHFATLAPNLALTNADFAVI